MFLLILVSACAKSVWAPDDEVTKASYSPAGEPASIILVTVINNRDGSGGHSALIINAHERVAFDPAGNWKSRYAPERNDFVYGMNPQVLKLFYSFHARKAWHVVLQKKEVSPEVAEMVYAAARD
ncbi:MAG: hypothetical protein ACE5DK_12315, partial [Paracoccaceae bacterium]